MTKLQQVEALLPQLSERDAIDLFSRFFNRPNLSRKKAES